MPEVRRIQWLRPWPGSYVFTTLGVVIALVAGAEVLVYAYHSSWRPLERVYLRSYLWSGIQITALSRPKVFEVLLTDRERRLATHRDVREGRMLRWSSYVLTDRAWHDWLRVNIYGGRAVLELLKPGLYGFMLSLLLLLPFGMWEDFKRARARRQGVVLRGSQLVSRQTYHLLNRSNSGVGWLTSGESSFLERLIVRAGDEQMVRTDLKREDHHFLLAGDTGAGKSNLIRQMMRQVRARGEDFVAYDPAREYVSEFFNPERDVILNPFDERCPSWSMSEEVVDDGDAAAISKALFPDIVRGRKDDPFFLEKGRTVFEHLLKLRPRIEELYEWVSNIDDRIDRLVKGAAVANALSGKAYPQRAGILGVVTRANTVLDAARRTAKREHKWLAESWVNGGKGSIFITSTPRSRDALRPLISLWLDILIMKLSARDGASSRPVWVFLDEVGALENIPKLPDAITQTRKMNLRLVLGIQGRTQLEQRYDLESEVMLSQPYHKIFMRLSEPKSAEWASNSIGGQEAEDMREGRTWGGRESKNASTEIRSRPAVMPSEIQNLPDGWGFFRVPGLCVKLQFPYIAPKAVQPGFIPAPAEFPEIPLPASEEPELEPEFPGLSQVPWS
jgi:hypothetical protein